MKKIDNYAILGKKKHCDGCYFIDGFKSLPTLKKRYDIMCNTLKSVPHDSIFLCSRDEDKNILKIYHKFE